MNNTSERGCKPINERDHPHVYKLLSYASYLKTWRQNVHPGNYLPLSTYEDCSMTCTGVVLTARYYLPKWSAGGYDDEDIFQKCHGTDDAEK